MQDLLVKHVQELAKTSHGFVGSKHLTLVGRGDNDQSIADCTSSCRKAMNIGQKLAEKESLGLKYTQLVRSGITERYQIITCIY